MIRMNRLPAEWEPQSAVMLTWPRPDGNFAAFYADMTRCMHTIVMSIAGYEPVLLSVHDAQQLAAVQALFADAASLPNPIRFLVAPNDDVWARDHGPIGIYANGSLKLCKFGFDGWGGKHAYARDNALVPVLAAQGAFSPTPLIEQPIVLEGGAIETDGAGSLLATRRSVLDPKRNPGRSACEIEQVLREALGIHRFLWLDHGGLAGDDTDGHIDTLARFVSPTQIAYQQSGGPQDPNHEDLCALEVELKALRQSDGQPYALHPLPAPGHHRDPHGKTLPASYANFLVINGAVLMPTYAAAADADALTCLRDLFPGRDVIGIDCRVLIRQYGSLHCVTMNIPA
jgi:agmatine/peptidylarginine deiminase